MPTELTQETVPPCPGPAPGRPSRPAPTCGAWLLRILASNLFLDETRRRETATRDDGRRGAGGPREGTGSGSRNPRTGGPGASLRRRARRDDPAGVSPTGHRGAVFPRHRPDGRHPREEAARWHMHQARTKLVERRIPPRRGREAIMNCNDVRPILLAADSAHPAKQSAEVRAHLDGCRECCKFTERLFRLEREWKALPMPVGADAAKHAFLRRLAGDVARPTEEIVRSRRAGSEAAEVAAPGHRRHRRRVAAAGRVACRLAIVARRAGSVPGDGQGQAARRHAQLEFRTGRGERDGCRAQLSSRKRSEVPGPGCNW